MMVGVMMARMQRIAKRIVVVIAEMAPPEIPLEKNVTLIACVVILKAININVYGNLDCNLLVEILLSYWNRIVVV
jgi:hypothetical protein